jgi:predicted DNA-binding transcriptional regulator YafY
MCYTLSYENEKKLSRTSLPRIYFIDSRIASGAYPNTSTLAAEYEVSEATISRDIELMRNRLHAPIAYDALHRGYYYTQKSCRLPAGYASAQDMLALGMAKTLLTLYRNTPLHDAVDRLLDSITAPLAADGASQWYKDRIVVPPVASIIIPEGIWEPIITGLRENRVIAFEYCGIWDEGYKPRRVRPYQLLFDNGVWYLYGYAEERKAIRMFSLPRMRNAVDQDIEETDDGVLIYFSSTRHKVLEWVLSRGCTARPFAPEALVKDWKRHVIEMGRTAKKC